MADNRSSAQFAEAYVNRCYENHEASRWWAHPLILVGGSICDLADFAHLRDAFGVDAVISVETEHVDDGKIPPGVPAFRFPFPDDGTPPSFEIWKAISEAWDRLGPDFWMLQLRGGHVYVHCQQGGSRSPAVAYFLMRTKLNHDAEGALASIREYKTDYGHHPFHASYLASAEAAIARGFAK